MSVEVCSQCHNTTFHFDRAKHAVVCDVCGWERNGSERAGEMLVYDQYRQKAIAFVKARDYASAKPFLEKMRNIKPDDSDIYYLHLMGLTDCCQNLLLKPTDSQTYALVQNYWNTFCQLRGDPHIFQKYFYRRERETKDKRDKEIVKKSSLALLCYVPALVFLALSFANIYWCIAPSLIMILIIIYKKPLISLFRLLHNKKY